MRSRQWLAVAAGGSARLGVAACGAAATSDIDRRGRRRQPPAARSTARARRSPQPIYQQWGSDLKDQGITSTTRPSARAPASPQFAAGTADFAASDPALDAEDARPIKKGPPSRSRRCSAPSRSPTTWRASTKGLKLDGKTVADIFLGKVKKWNDPAIAKLNPGVNAARAATSRWSTAPTSRARPRASPRFLSDYSPEWKSKVGADKTVKWPTGTGAKGNAGVAGAVKQTDGAIGYVEEAYALQNNFTTADVKNKSGKFIEPTLASTTAAGEGITVPADLGISAHRLAEPEGLPDRLADVHRRPQGPLQGRA